MQRFVVGLIVVILVLSGASAGLPLSAAQGDYTPIIQWDVCPFGTPVGEREGESLDCGHLVVPQNRADPDGVKVELAFAILYSTSSAPVPDPILYLEGGPGGSALSGVDLWLDSPFRVQRDIILLDQRGTGYSYPYLGCWELYDLADDASMQEEDDALSACQQRLKAEDGVDLSMYTSAQNAADVADLYQALDYSEWNLFGISYGTRLALTVMRDYPAGVRSVILDSTYPPVVDAYEEDVVNAYRVFEVLFAGCAADPACNAAYPNLGQTFYRLVDQWNANPLDLAELDVAFTGDDLIGFFFDLLYDTSVIPYLPLTIHELGQGQYDAFIALYDGGLPGEDVDGSGLYGSNEDLVFLFVDEVGWLLEDVDDATYYDFFDQVYDLLYLYQDFQGFADLIAATFAPEDADYLIELLDDMSDADLSRLPAELYYGDVSDADGMFNSVECNEEAPFNTLADAEALAVDLPDQFSESGLATFEQFQATCAVWQSGTADAIEDAAVTSTIPTLIVAGEYDPITPPAWGRIAGETLSNSYFFEFPGVGHGVIDGGDCPVSMMQAFLANPAAAPASDCLAAMSGPAFVTP